MVTRTRFVVLQHAHEVKKQSNTARMAALALRSCEVRLFGAEGVALQADDLSEPGTWLLFPSDGPAAPPPKPCSVARLVVLDGSWSQARRMLQRIAQLRGLPRLSLTPAAGRASLRTAPPGGMSTLEAIARAVELLEGPSLAAPLDRLHGAMVQRVVRSRGYL